MSKIQNNKNKVTTKVVPEQDKPQRVKEQQGDDNKLLATPTPNPLAANSLVNINLENYDK